MAMRLIGVTLATLFVVLISFLTVKYWGKSHVYVEYKHPFYSAPTSVNSSDTSLAEPLVFIKPKYENVRAEIEGTQNLYLDVSVTLDQILVTPTQKFEKPIRYSNFEEIKDKVISIGQIAPHMKGERKFILNLIENAHAMHEILMVNFRKYRLEDGKSFLIVGEYEAPIKALKEIAPALLYGSTKPEILKLLAMESMGLLEAVNLRADAVIHPLQIRKQNFFTENLIQEITRRHKKIIVGVIPITELEQAKALKPFAVVVEQ
jgi:hypothetical protein